MDIQKHGIRRIPPRLVVFILLASVIHPVFSQYSATVTLEPPKAVEGERVRIRIRTSIPWGDNVQINRPELNGSMVWWAYPYARSWTPSDSEGRFVEVLAAVRVDSAGLHSIAPFQINVADREVLSGISRIVGLKADERDFSYPLILSWRSLPEKIWQGQSFPVMLEARNRESLVLPESIAIENRPKGILVEAPGFGIVGTRPYGNEILYDVPISCWIWTLDKPGKFSFPETEVKVNGLDRSIGGFSVDILPLPEEALSSAAVGRFDMDVQWNNQEHHVGDIISIRVHISGSGNFGVLRGPRPELDGATLMNTGTSSSYIPSLAGFEGWMEYRYDFRLDKTGKLKLTVPEWTWFNPAASGQLMRESAQSFFITAQNAVLESHTSSSQRLLGDRLFSYRKTVFSGRNIHWYLLTLPGFLVFMVLLMIRRRGLRFLNLVLFSTLLLAASNTDAADSRKAREALTYAQNGDWETAAELYGELQLKYAELPGLLSDRALVAMEMGQAELSVRLIRRALYLKPGSRHLLNTLHFIESRLGLSGQMPVTLRYSPVWVFSLWLIMVNAVFFALSRLLFHSDGRNVIVLSSVLILLFFFTALFIYTERLRDIPYAVVKEDSQALRKIPGPLGTDWVKLPSGTSLGIVAREDDYVLVATGYGLQGWLPESSLHIAGEEQQ